MEREYKKYYREMFNVYSESLFMKLWGTTKDDDGFDYTILFIWELRDLANKFANYMYILDKYNVSKKEESVADFLLIGLDSLGDVVDKDGAYIIARSMVDAINNRLSMNNIEHPLCGIEKDNLDVVVDGDVPRTYLLIQEEGYTTSGLNSKIIASSKYIDKLKSLCDDRVRRLKSTTSFVGYQEREGVLDAYRQLVDERRRLKITWKIEEVFEV